MPFRTEPFTNGAPVVRLALSHSADDLRSLQSAGKPLPDARSARGLIDSGASQTCIASALPEALGMQPRGFRYVLTASTGAVPVLVATFEVGLIVLQDGKDHLLLPEISVNGSKNLAAHGFEVLLGRDVLAHCLLVYDGK